MAKKNLYKRGIIDLRRDDYYGKAELVEALKSLRSMIFFIAGSCKDIELNAAEFSENLFVLNYLIEEVDYVDKSDYRK